MGRSVLVVGMGISGRSASSYLLHLGFHVIGVDLQKKVLEQQAETQLLLKRGLELIGEEDLKNQKKRIAWESVDFVVVSPGVALTNFICQEAILFKKEVIGEVELACRALTNNRWIGITGTNGKTTVTLLVNHILNESKVAAKALGNVGTALCSSILDIQDEVIVAELSSYQLETMHTPVLDCAVILNITPDHLDRYSTMEAYVKAKLSIQNCLKQNTQLYVHELVAKNWKQDLHFFRTFGYSPASFIFSDQEALYIQGKKAVSLPQEYRGKMSHDVENFMAAYLLCKELGVSDKDFEKHFSTFKKPAHRVEFVGEINGVSYYDDSKGTNLDAVVRAVESIDAPIVLIAGGVHKGASYKAWLHTFKGKVKAVCAIGQAANLLHEELSESIAVQICSTLSEAVHHGTSLCSKGDAVVLSPGCSSFDMFRDYAHRGDEFKKCVWALTEESI
ncbi:MAG: UDP-N-acetylmuramoyl-L-alanine--D-glutamate ligase [Chlamydiales bacterium]|nr:UDP-N-acetylmuramoyl-L-alanine--D-glutamate ligase [Chlamydiales bacterium]